MKNRTVQTPMGGRGSGRSPYATTPTVSECRSLDVNDLRDEGCLAAGAGGVLRWEDGDETERPSSIHFQTSDDGETVTLSHAAGLREPESPDREEYDVGIERTPCNFGGERPWFRCPGEECGRRVGKLYLPPGGDHFLCRHCYDLAYESSRASGNSKKTAKLRYERAHRKLEPDSDLHHPALGTLAVRKPDGMHWDTYDAIHADLKTAHDDWMRAHMWTTASRLGRFERLYDRVGMDNASKERKESRKEVKEAIDNGDLWLCPGDAAMLDSMGLR